MKLSPETSMVFLAKLLIASMLIAGASADAELSLSESQREKVEALDAPLRAFIESGDVLQFLPQRQLDHEIAARDVPALGRLIEDLMALADEMAYDPERDMGAAPLNIESRRFNPVTTPPLLRELERAPGPFSVHRYLVPESGVPTFAGAKVAIWPEDLVAGKVDVAIVGVPGNFSSGRRDAANGPNAMRALNTIATPDIQSLIQPLDVLSVADYGNFAVDPLSVERSIGHVTAMVTETARTGAVPMLVGGDTSMLYPGVKGIAEARGAGSFGLLYFSAHPDVDRLSAHRISDRQVIFRLIDQGIVSGDETFLMGLRGRDVDESSLGWLRDRQVRYHTMAEVQQQGLDAVLKQLIEEVEAGPDALFVSIDVSAIDPASMIAAGRMETGGLEFSGVRRAIRRVCATREIVGFELTDLAPMLDGSRLSVANANALLNACLVGIALRATGVGPDHVHPLARDHGQR